MNTNIRFNCDLVRSLGLNNDDLFNGKIILKTMNFSPSHGSNNIKGLPYIKDCLLILSFISAVCGLLATFIQYRCSKHHQKKVLKDMESLQKAEDQLHELQKELDRAKLEHELAASDKSRYQHYSTSPENRYFLDPGIINDSSYHQYNHAASTSLSTADINDNYSNQRTYELEEELRQTREQLSRAETALANKSWAPPHQLQLWLQLTHELELNHYNSKRHAAKAQLISAKEGCEKLKKKRSSFFGSLRVAHSSSIDDVDNRILQAKQALSEIIRDLKERLYRWQQIELLCGFPIVHNKGLPVIQAELLAHYSKNLSGSNEIHRAHSDSGLQEMDSEATTYKKSPNFNRSSFRQKSNRSTHSPDRTSIITTPTSIGHHFTVDSHLLHPPSHHSHHSHHHHQKQQQQQQSGNEITNGLSDSNYQESGSEEDSNESDADNRTRYLRPVFTLGDGRLTPTLNEGSVGSSHRRTWSSIRRAPGRPKSPKSPIEISKSHSHTFGQSTEVNGESIKLVSNRAKRVSIGDTVCIKDTHRISSSSSSSAVSDDSQCDDKSENSGSSSRKIITKSANQQSTNHNDNEQKSKQKKEEKDQVSEIPIKRSISLYIKGARRSINFLSQKRKKLAPESN